MCLGPAGYIWALVLAISTVDRREKAGERRFLSPIYEYVVCTYISPGVFVPAACHMSEKQMKKKKTVN